MAAPVHRQVDPRDEAGRVGRQEGDGLRHLLHLPRAAQRVRLLALLQELVVEEDTNNTHS